MKIFILLAFGVCLSIAKPKPEVLDDLAENLADEILAKIEKRHHHKKNPVQGCKFNCTIKPQLVCGDDGLTYGNECRMKERACWNNRKVTKRHDGPCGGGLVEQLKEKVIAEESKRTVVKKQQPKNNKRAHRPTFKRYVKATEDFLAARAERRSKLFEKRGKAAAKKGKHQGGGSRPDDKRKPKKKRDHHGHHHTHVKKLGKKAIQRIMGLIQEMNLKHMKCNLRCQMHKSEVCGTNGKTYHNECYLNEYACIHDGEIKVAKQGSCHPPLELVDGKLPTTPATTTHAHHHHHHHNMICSATCRQNDVQLCGDDGITYPDECYLFRHRCVTNKVIKIKHVGKCVSLGKLTHHLGIPEEETKRDAPNFKVKGDPLKGLCPQQRCGRIYLPVCGTDGKTYPNECEFNNVNCPSNGQVTIAYHHACGSMGGKGDERPTVSDHLVSGHNCFEVCKQQFDPVCGTDNKSYLNLCELGNHNCREHTHVNVKHPGQCKEPPKDANAKEKDPFLGDCIGVCTAIYLPVCGTDGETYPNMCELDSYNCGRSHKVGVAYPGQCVPNEPRRG